jgi:hypothetical protein
MGLRSFFNSKSKLPQTVPRCPFHRALNLPVGEPSDGCRVGGRCLRSDRSWMSSTVVDAGILAHASVDYIRKVEWAEHESGGSNQGWRNKETGPLGAMVCTRHSGPAGIMKPGRPPLQRPARQRSLRLVFEVCSLTLLSPYCARRPKAFNQAARSNWEGHLPMGIRVNVPPFRVKEASLA